MKDCDSFAYFFKITWFDEYAEPYGKEESDSGFIAANSFSEAVVALENYYEEDLVSIDCLRPLGMGQVITKEDIEAVQVI